MIISGFIYDGQSSRQQAVQLIVGEHGQTQLVCADKSVVYEGEFSSLKISSRLGNSTRYIYLPDGQTFETRDNDEVDALLKKHNAAGPLSLHILESRWRYVISATVLFVLLVAWFVVDGVPLTARLIAHQLPSDLLAEAGEETLAYLEDSTFQPTTLSSATRERIEQHFSGIIEQHPELPIKLLFRSSYIGPNAFALPDGTIVFTDAMVRLAENDDELLSVMAHEIAHIHHKHAMRGLIQSSVVGAVALLVIGDMSTLAEWFLGIPIILTQLGYSRDFEREADDYAFEYLTEQGISPKHFSNLMSRVANAHCDIAQDEPEAEDLAEPCDDRGWQKYLSTHPGIQERLDKFDSQAQGAGND